MRGMALSGHLLPNLQKLFAGSSESYATGWQAVKKLHRRGDVLILAIISLLPIPISKLYHNIYYRIATKFGGVKPTEYEKSRIFKVGRAVSQGGRIGAVVYAIELITTFTLAILAEIHNPTTILKSASLPKHLMPLQKFPGLFANCAYGIWVARGVVEIKSTLLKKFYSRLPDPETYDRLIDFFIYVFASILILESSQVDLGALVKSLVAIGGLSSIVVGLALQGPATQLLQGALLMVANKYRRQEQIKLGDGTQGKVVDIGLLETTIMDGDDIQTRIPNTKIAGQNFSNLSRMNLSHVKFELRFHLYDIDRVKEIIAAIREEIVEACPNLITDGARPFRVVWTDIKEDHIVVTVDTHHRIPPACNAYWENREKALLAIAKATKKKKVDFALPIRLRAQLE
eukprot:CAMPEP_0194218610 /NCGR_PEP_ID=MMETSP0156-20130528/24150_1 /TAXON_ID=33649 /ORGANISM="Thalassionema nitzschioides, Strain L26-B" /LENGTH=400 /DNA_ID=CAMNT_0038948023 /DNA_START=340 /DNA_END=1542 /DNA_ORIENTATION=+